MEKFEAKHTRIYVGSGIGRVLLKRIFAAKKRIFILSPYINGKLEEKIKRMSGRVKVKIIKDPFERDIRIAKAALLILALVFLPLLPVASLLLLALAFLVRSPARNHAKIYAVDDRIYLSSANFTAAGLFSNNEFMVEIAGEEAEALRKKIFGE